MIDVFGCEFRIDSNVLGHAFIKYQRRLISNKMNLNWDISNSDKR